MRGAILAFEECLKVLVSPLIRPIFLRDWCTMTHHGESPSYCTLCAHNPRMVRRQAANLG